MTAPTSHTPLPWSFDGVAPRITAGQRVIASVGDLCTGSQWPEDKANAELIVRAVNAHAELLSALEELADDYYHTWQFETDQQSGPPEETSEAYRAARALIAKIRGTT